MNKNINNHNGKEIHRDQTPKNVKKQGEAKQGERFKKKNPGSNKDIQHGEPRKAPISIHKKINMTNQEAPNAQAVDLANKDKGIHRVDASTRKTQSQEGNPVSSSANEQSFAKHSSANTTTADHPRNDNYNTVSPKDSSATGKYLYVVAALLLIAWIIGFFFYKLEASIHMLLALAIIVGVISFLQGRK